MIRRRRPPREFAFSFDSFLDVVANVVGIIIRMILVVWVGARAYTSLQAPPPPAPTAMEQREPVDPLQQELEQRRRELAQLQGRLLDQQGQVEDGKTRSEQIALELAEAKVRREGLEKEKSALIAAGQLDEKRQVSAAALLAELRERNRRLKEAVAAQEKQTPAKQVLRYRSPVSRPVQTEELIFECQAGRVTFIDVDGLLQEVRHGMRDKAATLRTRWEVSDVTGSVGPFRLRYTIERQRDSALPVPDPHAEFRYGISAWTVEPILRVRGETAATALAANSEFRQIVDVLDPQTTTVTFCVYPDSFTLYRQLRDYLQQRELAVAGRPLPEGNPIASSRNGTVSRGQ